MTRPLPHLLIASILVIFSINTAYAEMTFSQWKKEFNNLAQKEGISQQAFNATMDKVTAPDPSVIKKANYQPEFTTKIWDYLDARITPFAISKGQALAIEHKETLDLIEQRFGVSRYIILAIWSMESNYGAILQRTDRLHYVPEALATLAYQDSRRAKFARTQLLALLQMVDNGDIAPDQLMGSWAGAMGHTQFIPTSYKAYGVSIDGNKGVDIWNSIPDALATAASLLSENGWRTGRTWGYEVVVPRTAFALKNETKTIQDWSNLGLQRTHSRTFTQSHENAILKTLAGDSGPGFLALRNFFVIKKYNNSDFYALAVGLLADQIAGYTPMQQEWPRPPGALTLSQKYEVQRLLKQQGFYDGAIDGSIGSGSRAAIKKYQKHTNQEITGVANTDLLHSLKNI